jgi:hypothetical protein
MMEPSHRATALNLVLRNTVIAFVCLALILPAFGQQAFQTLLVGLDHRTVISLNGDWHYLVDHLPAALFTRGTARSMTSPML